MSDDVKAGEYELTALQWDQTTSKPGEPFDFKRHRRGDKVTLDVEDARRLVRAGAVAKPGERERVRVEAARAVLNAALAALPDDVRTEVAGDVEVPEPAQSEPPEDEHEAPGGGDGPPPQVANKAAWVDYAVSQGAVQSDAEAATKQDLIDQYGA